MRSQLSQGVSILYDMELNNYYTTRAINQLNYRIPRLGIKKKIAVPTKRKNDVFFFDSIIIMVIIIGIIGAVIDAIVQIILAEGFFEKIGYAFAGVIEGAFYGAGVGLVIGIIYYFSKKSRRNKGIEEDYSQAIKSYEIAIANDNKRVARELKEKEQLKEQLSSLRLRSKEANKNLNHFYATMNIDDNYRNLIVMGYMNEFIRLGIATKLEGADGLYYLIRNELRMDQMQYTLDEICNKLDELVDRQSALYGELLRMNDRCDSMVNATVKQAQQLNAIADNTQIAAYNSERIEKELMYQNFMLTYNIL